MSKEVHLRANPSNTTHLRKLQEKFKLKFPTLRPISLDDLGNLAIELGIQKVADHLNLN